MKSLVPVVLLACSLSGCSRDRGVQAAEGQKPRGVKVSCLCPGPTRTEFGEVAGFVGNGLFDHLAMTAKQVVAKGLKGLDKNQAVVVPGLINKVGAASTRFAPRPVVRRIAGAIKY